MRWKTTAILAVLLVGLGTFYYVYEIRQAPDREKTASLKDRLWKDLEAKDVDEIVVTKGAQTLHLKKTGEVWALAAPVQAPADRTAADGLASSLATLRVEREIEAAPAKPADYGLEPPAAVVTFRAKGQEKGVRLGGKSPTGLWAYAQEAGKPAVLLVPESLLQDAQKPVADFRDRTLMTVDRKDVRKLEVRGPTGQVVVAAEVRDRDKDEWALTAPLAAPADREAISGLLDKLRAARIKEFVSDAPKSLMEYGLDRATRLTLDLAGAKPGAARGLRLGKAVPEKKAVYAQREGEGTVLLLDEELAKAVPASATALRDKTVFAYDRAKLERVELESAKGKVALALQAGQWRITAPTALQADEGRMSQMLFRARDLRAREFVTEDARRLAAYGLDKPRVRLSVWEKDAKEPKTLLLGSGREADRAYAVARGPAAGTSGVMAIDPKAIEDLSLAAVDLRDRSLSAAFDTKEVARLTIERPGQTLVLERTGSADEDWTLAAPKRGKARGGRVSELLWTLRNLKWKDLVAEQGWDPGRYGLDQAATTVTVAGKDGKPLAAVALGKQEGGLTYARIPGQPALYAIETKTLGELPTAPEELLL
jgi:hypothetical protein